MSDIETITQMLKNRLTIGYERYGRGLLHPLNDHLDYKKEAMEEVLDQIIYASANAVRKTPQVSTKLEIEYDNDEPRVKLDITVNYEMENDGNDAVLNNIVHHANRKYEYGFDKITNENNLMLLGLGVLSSYLDT
ncbi:hypothetical protein NY2A_B801L [Paramecium bursaria Chlorella virus NY2A]|uniref:Uncharacterized protein B801L n=1 Tax=Paramecium bursaria Chlorella virus NY2A TaxID=46021 RepID=A7IXX6_PBCVN|nr:hypothetical protein NY2A_B801L [Paramecium bursaria Chlorella virus NY2A]ABT15200.1 hypothetical protein NY2A_B801L [Paramecium bursaria Chlorella virus NY2A]